jgi:hypothetical protein
MFWQPCSGYPRPAYGRQLAYLFDMLDSISLLWRPFWRGKFRVLLSVDVSHLWCHLKRCNLWVMRGALTRLTRHAGPLLHLRPLLCVWVEPLSISRRPMSLSGPHVEHPSCYHAQVQPQVQHGSSHHLHWWFSPATHIIAWTPTRARRQLGDVSIISYTQMSGRISILINLTTRTAPTPITIEDEVGWVIHSAHRTHYNWTELWHEYSPLANYVMCLVGQSQSQSYITTDSQSWCQAPIWDPRPIFPLLSLIIF